MLICCANTFFTALTEMGIKPTPVLFISHATALIVHLLKDLNNVVLSHWLVTSSSARTAALDRHDKFTGGRTLNFTTVCTMK